MVDRENLHRDNGYSIGNVIYLNTFSKTLAPGIRLAWIVAPPDVISKLVALKQGADLHTSTFIQWVAYEVARDRFLDDHAKRIRQIYRERRDAMFDALREFFRKKPPGRVPKAACFCGPRCQRVWIHKRYSGEHSKRKWRSCRVIPFMPTMTQKAAATCA